MKHVAIAASAALLALACAPTSASPAEAGMTLPVHFSGTSATPNFPPGAVI